MALKVKTDKMKIPATIKVAGIFVRDHSSTLEI